MLASKSHFKTSCWRHADIYKGDQALNSTCRPAKPEGMHWVLHHTFHELVHHLSRLHFLQVVDLSSGFESESEGELPNPKRTPGARSKRQRMTYEEDDSPGLDHDDAQVRF